MTATALWLLLDVSHRACHAHSAHLFSDAFAAAAAAVDDFVHDGGSGGAAFIAPWQLIELQEKVDSLKLRLQKFGSISSSSSSSVRLRTFVGKGGSTGVTYHEVCKAPVPPQLFMRSGFPLNRKAASAAPSKRS
jgi:hypothetical protein